MRVCVIGAKGNMGRRYCSILRFLEHEVLEVDESDFLPYDVEYFIIATPTDTHLNQLAYVKAHGYGNPLFNPKILIEKPLCRTDVQGIDAAIMSNVYMVNQYAYVRRNGPQRGDTVYNFYNSGKDGLAWDCIQLIHLAKGKVELSNDSPYRICKINGSSITTEVVDHCYIRMVRDFLSDGGEFGNLWGLDDIIAAHKKVIEYEENTNRRSGPVGLYQVKG